MISEKQAVDEIITDEKCWLALAKVTTIREVMRWYDIDYATYVQYYIDKGDIIATKVAGTWLVSVDSVVRFWGKPQNIA